LKFRGPRAVDPAIASHRGRIVKTTGDGVLAEFAGAVDAVRCAVEVLRGMAAQNGGVPQDTRIEFRIGIHVGDIIIDDADIFGDGVNLAARLEGIAEPGGVCISEDAQRQIRGKVDAAFVVDLRFRLRAQCRPAEARGSDRDIAGSGLTGQRLRSTLLRRSGAAMRRPVGMADGISAQGKFSQVSANAALATVVRRCFGPPSFVHLS
jgi:class 3 adenylate cyclase